MYGGESLDNSANEIYLQHIKEISAAFARADTREAAERKLAVKTLWRCAGRASEPSKIMYVTESGSAGVKWNTLFDCPVVVAPQPKTAKVKNIPFIPGADRHSDWVLDFADELCLQRGEMEYRSAVAMPVLPFLSGDSSGTQIGNYLKGLQARHAHHRHAHHRHARPPSSPPHKTLGSRIP